MAKRVRRMSERVRPVSERLRYEGGGKRSEIVTVRFDPRLKYLAELAARKHRRPLSSFIEWAVEQTVSHIVLRQDRHGTDVTVTEADLKFHLWDPDEPDRIVRLAFNYPELMTLEEQVLWKLVCETGFLWKGSFVGNPPVWGWIADKQSIIWERLREHWTLIREVAAGRKSPTDLPGLPKPPTSKSQKLSGDDESHLDRGRSK